MWSRPFWCVRRMRPGLVEGCLGRMITASRRMPRLERGKVDLNSARDTLWSGSGWQTSLRSRTPRYRGHAHQPGSFVRFSMKNR